MSYFRPRPLEWDGGFCFNRGMDIAIFSKSRLWGLCTWVGAAVLAFVVLATAAPVHADSESWTLWASTWQNCESWSGECDSNAIFVSSTGSYINTPQLTCTDALLSIQRAESDAALLVRVSSPIRDMTMAAGGTFEQFRVFGLSASRITLYDMGGDDQYVYGVVIECFDPLPESTTVETVSYGEGGVIVALLFVAGVGLLNTMIHLGERVTDR